MMECMEWLKGIDFSIIFLCILNILMIELEYMRRSVDLSNSKNRMEWLDY